MQMDAVYIFDIPPNVVNLSVEPPAQMTRKKSLKKDDSLGSGEFNFLGDVFDLFQKFRLYPL